MDPDQVPGHIIIIIIIIIIAPLMSVSVLQVQAVIVIVILMVIMWAENVIEIIINKESHYCRHRRTSGLCSRSRRLCLRRKFNFIICLVSSNLQAGNCLFIGYAMLWYIGARHARLVYRLAGMRI